jgi:hypothetical protein
MVGDKGSLQGEERYAADLVSQHCEGMLRA